MADDTITIPSGQLVDSSSVTNAAGSTVERQRMSIADPTVGFNPGMIAGVSGGSLSVENSEGWMLRMILKELRVLTSIVADGLNVNYDLDKMRNDPTLLGIEDLEI